MYLKREYSLDYFINHIYSDEFVVLTSRVKEDVRSQKLFECLHPVRNVTIDYTVNMNSEGFLNDKFILKTNYKSPLNNRYCHSLYQELHEFAAELNRESKRIVIDISSIHIRFLGAFLAAISDFKWDSILCSYTEPTAYHILKESDPINRKNNLRSAAFDLNSSFWGYNEIPNLKTITSDQSDYFWIVFLGFEGKRAAAVYSEISDDVKTVIPVITMPSIRPGWANSAFDANQILFENASLYCSDLCYTDAMDPFAAYNLIDKFQREHPKHHFVLSPLGTRPISLGVLLYALKHEESEIYYDTPKESSSKVVDCGDIHVYDILSFYNQEV